MRWTFPSFEKVRTSLESTLLKVEEVEKRCTDYELENAKLKKKIPCKDETCDRDRRCENSHQLHYEDRREPRESRWRKTLPCKFFNTPAGCKNTDEKCSFIHESRSSRNQRRYSEQSRDSDNGPPSYIDINLQKFRRMSEVKEENVEDSSIEELSPGSRQPLRNRRYQEEGPVSKKIKIEVKPEPLSGNESGATGRPHQAAPNYGGRSRGVQGGANWDGTGGARGSPSTRPKRKFSPIRSPTEEREVPRDREVDWQVYRRAQHDLRFQMNSRRRISSARGRGQRQDPDLSFEDAARRNWWNRRPSHGGR